MSRVLFFGSRNLGWRHWQVMRTLAWHALRQDCDLALFIEQADSVASDSSLWANVPKWPKEEPLVLLHGDGPPGKTPGAVGADKLAEGACMDVWPERRRVRRFPVEQASGEAWGVAAARRNAAMVAARPHRAYCVHESLDQSKGSAMTASFLLKAGIPYWRVDVRLSGEVVDVRLVTPGT